MNGFQIYKQTPVNNISLKAPFSITGSVNTYTKNISICINDVCDFQQPYELHDKIGSVGIRSYEIVFNFQLFFLDLQIPLIGLMERQMEV